jgi:hypothetical protein
VVNLHRNWGGQFAPFLGGQFVRNIHSYATSLMRGGISKDEIGTMMGHSNSSVTEHYLGTLDIERTQQINSVLQ